ARQQVSWQRKGTVAAAVEEHSWAADDGELVKGLLVAGLAPQVAKAELSRSFRSGLEPVRQRQGKTPNRVEGRYSLKLFTVDEGRLNLPFSLSSSLLAKQQVWLGKGPQPPEEGGLPPLWVSHRWLVYSDKVKFNSEVVPSTLSSVPDVALLLFGSDLNYAAEEAEGRVAEGEEENHALLSMEQGLMSWRMPAAHAQAVVGVRRQMAQLLQRQLQEPSLMFRQEARQLTARLQQLLADAAADP
ncbi:DExH-box ATP-dependent RNA helicase DExH3, partial [Haematococcus lacustris]